ncbi:hypothetical protein D0859_12211 [Hortaea werneckii]|uniref:NmrA-like domain-containing protein n=1 Tax=Hortaea werneckii TaxID=91943 RepID=A0A3M7IE81_HORWE|nr:hypothetical protein D0859_12211 [Hortaea werneckii]
MLEANLDSLASLSKAFSDATYIFATTDSNQNIFHAIQHPEVLHPGQTAPAVTTPKLRRMVWSSLPSPRKWSGGLYTKVTMFDTKDDILEIIKAKPELQAKTSTLLVGFYATNALNVPELYGPRLESDGVYELALPMSGEIPVPMADLDSDMGKWVKALFEAAPGLTLVGSTELITWAEWLRLWAKHNGVSARYRRASTAEYSARVEGISDAVSEEFAFIEQYGFTGGDKSVVYPDQVRVLHFDLFEMKSDPRQVRQSGITIERSSMEEHIARCDWSSILGGHNFTSNLAVNVKDGATFVPAIYVVEALSFGHAREH